MAKLISISLLDEEISAERLMEALFKLSSRDLRKYFKRKKMVFPRNLRYAFLTKCIKRDFQAVSKDLLDSNNRVFTEFELVEFYRCVENDVLANEFKKEFLAYFVKNTYKNLLTDKNLADLYEIAQTKEESAIESVYSFLVGLNPIFTDTEENNLDCLPVEQTAQRIKDQFTLFEVREFARKYGVVVPKYPNADAIAPIIIEKAEARQLLDEEGFASLQNAESHALLSFAKKNGIYAPRYLKKDEMIDEVISQISKKDIDNVKINEVFNSNLITFKSRSSNDSLCDLLDKYENLDDLSEVRNDNSKDMSPLKRCAVGGAIGLELRYNEESRKLRLAERRRKLEELRQAALERREKFNHERREQMLIAQRSEEEAKRIAAEQRIAELEALLAQQALEKEEADKARTTLEEALREEEAKRIAAEQRIVETPVPVVADEENETEEEVFGEDEIVVPEYVDVIVTEEFETEEEKEVTYMDCDMVEEEAYVPEVIETPIIEEVVEEVVEETPVEEEPVVEEVLEEPVEEVEEVAEETTEEETPTEEEKVEPVRCPVKKLHGIGWILTLVVLAALAVLYFLVPTFNETFTKLFLKNDSVEFGTIEYLVLFGVTCVAGGVVTLLLRTIFHAIGCKAKKKGIACSKLSACYKFAWTQLVVTVAAIVAFIYTKLFHFGTAKQNIANLITKIFGSEFEITVGEVLLVILLVVVASYVITLLLSTLGYLFKIKKLREKGIMGRYISFSWTNIIVVALLVVALFVVTPNLITAIINEVIESCKAVLPLTATPLVVNAADSTIMPATTPSVDQTILTVVVALVALYLLSLIITSIGYARKVKKAKAEKVEDTQIEEVVEETPVTEEIPTEEVIEPVVEEEGERLLFTTFEEAKLVEDLNDLNRMIGKVNEHVKDLSAIQARLYNELVGEEEIIVEPIVEEPHVVIPDLPGEEPVAEIPAEETPVVEPVEEPAEAPIEKPKKERKPKVKCPVRKGQKVWFVITLVLIAAFVGLSFVLEPVAAIKTQILDVFKAEEISGTINLAIFAGGIILATAILAFLFRLLVHPLGCKAKKGQTCYQRKENAKYLWTFFFFLVIVIALLYVMDWHGFASIITGGLNSFTSFPNLGIQGWGVLGLAVLLLVLLITSICTSKKANRKVREAKAKELALEETVAEEAKEENQSPYQQDVMYVPCMVNGNIQMVPVQQPSNANIQSAPVNGQQPMNIQPNIQYEQAVQNLQPLQIVQPIQLIQPISSIPVDYQNYNDYTNCQGQQSQTYQVYKQHLEMLEDAKATRSTYRKKKAKSFFWMLFVIALALVAYFVEPVKTYVFSGVEQFSKIPNLNLTGWIVLVVAAILALIFVISFFKFIAYSCKARKAKKKVRNLEEVVAQEYDLLSKINTRMSSVNPFGDAAPMYGNPYNSGIYDDISSPYNAYRDNGKAKGRKAR